MTDAPDTEIVVVGGGPIGLAIAWRLLRDGRSVTVFDDGQPAAAWRVAAGLLSPVAEGEYGHQAFTELAGEALAQYPRFVEELEVESGISIGFRRCASLVVALDQDEREELQRRFLLLRDELRLDVAWLRSPECREREPWLSARVVAGVSSPDDAHVNPRALVTALRRAVSTRGSELRQARVERVTQDAGGFAIEAGDETLHANRVVIAAGAWSGAIEGLPQALPVRPVRGQILRLHAEEGPSCLLQNKDVYLFRRASGEMILGATVEEQGFDVRSRAGGTFHLLELGLRIVPGLSEWELCEVGSGLRPATPDNAPLIGEIIPGLVAASGHYRTGILFAPTTAAAVSEIINNNELSPGLAPFNVNRFQLP